MRSSLMLLVAPAVLAAAACGSSGSASPQYDTARVSRGDLVQYVTATGTLDAVVTVDVGSQVSGKVAALNADFNSTVKKGQVIAEIEASTYAAALRQAVGDLASARATVLLKQQNLERKTALVPLKAASRSDLDLAQAELAQARASVVVREAVVESAQANLGYCRITSPVNGVVISRKVDVGQTLTAVMTTPVLFRIAQDITRMQISAAVSEADIGQVKAGQGVTFTVDAFPDETFRGTVAQVRRAPTTISNVVTYETIIAVENPEQKLFPGMTADVSVRVAQRAGVLKVPNAALRYTPPEGARFEQAAPGKLQPSERLVYTPGGAPSTLRAVPVRVGITDGVDTEIVQGISADLPVVTATLAGGAKTSAVRPGQGPPPAP